MHIPLTYPSSFEYYHLYSVPIKDQSLYKVVIPQHKYLLNSQLHFAHYDNECQKIGPSECLCSKADIQEIDETAPCEVKLLNSMTTGSSCQQNQIKVTRTIIKQIDKTNQWIFVFPETETIKLRCDPSLDESKNVEGPYLCEIPKNCRVTIKNLILTNKERKLLMSQPVLFPDFTENSDMLPMVNLDDHVKDYQLDDLQQLKEEAMNNQPELTVSNTYIKSSTWTIFVYLLILTIIILCYIYQKYIKKRRLNPTSATVHHQREEDIQLP